MWFNKCKPLTNIQTHTQKVLCTLARVRRCAPLGRAHHRTLAEIFCFDGSENILLRKTENFTRISMNLPLEIYAVPVSGTEPGRRESSCLLIILLRRKPNKEKSHSHTLTHRFFTRLLRLLNFRGDMMNRERRTGFFTCERGDNLYTLDLTQL
jgi:hypothetical protein